jgi:hypothetical protein
LTVNLKVNPSSVKKPEARQIFLPSEGFKGILGAPMGTAGGTLDGGWSGEVSVPGKILHFLCRDKLHPFEPISSLLRQTLRADR